MVERKSRKETTAVNINISNESKIQSGLLDTTLQQQHLLLTLTILCQMNNSLFHSDPAKFQAVNNLPVSHFCHVTLHFPKLTYETE